MLRTDQALSRRSSRLLVTVILVVTFSLIAIAVFTISRGWSDQDLQRRIEAREEAVRSGAD